MNCPHCKHACQEFEDQKEVIYFCINKECLSGFKFRKKKHGKVFNTFTYGILSTILLGLLNYFWVFFTQRFPDTQAKVKLLESNDKQHNKYLEKIDNRTESIMNFLINKK